MAANGWYRGAVVYALDVATFQDSNGDGVGDFPGLTARLDYLAALGVTTLWLQPFFASPRRDDGYDVSDYYTPRADLGDLGDFVTFMDAARERGLRVLMDLVVQHTSDDHPWFRSAVADPGSPYRDYYVWRGEPRDTEPVEQVFPGHQDGVWTRDERGGAFYRHHFYAHEPDLDVANPAVRAEIAKIVRFWTELGVTGFRIDAAPYLVSQAARGGGPDGGGDGHWVLRELRDLVDRRGGEIVLLGETDVDPHEYAGYFGGGDELHLLLNFYVNNAMFLALARADARPVADALTALPEPPGTGRYAYWLRNHDELDLGRLTPEEREQVYGVFAPDPDMRIYDRGIRRRLAPMLGGDERRLLAAHSLLLSLGEVSVLRQGDEIGMGDDLSLPERRSVRTAMQWSGDRHGGFTGAETPGVTVLADGRFGYRRVNVLEQELRPNSLLNGVRRLIAVRRQSPETAEGTRELLDVGEHSVFGVRHTFRGQALLALTNLAGGPVEVKLPEADRYAFLADEVADATYPAPDDSGQLRLDGYGYRWLRGRLSPSG